MDGSDWKEVLEKRIVAGEDLLCVTEGFDYLSGKEKSCQLLLLFFFSSLLVMKCVGFDTVGQGV